MATHESPLTPESQSLSAKSVETCVRLGGDRIHLHQLVTRDRGGFDQRYVVTRVNEAGVLLNDTDFEGAEFVVDEHRWRSGNYRARYADGIPVWVY